MLLTPIAAQTVGGVDYVGGPVVREWRQRQFVSNISLTDNGKNYYGTYFNDDWKVTPKSDRQSRFAVGFLRVGSGAPRESSQLRSVRTSFWRSGCTYPQRRAERGKLSSGRPTCFTDLLGQGWNQLAVTDQFGKGLGNSQKTNFAPRVGFAYQVTPKLVARGGLGLFYNGFENRGFSPNLGENYPFQFNFQFNSTQTTATRLFTAVVLRRGWPHRQCHSGNRIRLYSA